MATRDITAPTVPSEHVVHRSTNLLYTLMHDCWRNGREQFRNRLMVRVERDKSVSDAEYEATIARLSIALADWQPIAGAPTNGTVLLVFGSRGVERGWCVHGRWYWDGGSSLVDVPTHWMPLPTAPREEGGVTNV